MKPQNCIECSQFKIYIRKNLCKGCYFKQNPNKYKEHKYRVKKYAETLNGKFINAKRQAKERKIEWNISKKEYEYLITKSCDYCKGSLLTKGTGLDRIDSNLDYSVYNVVPCCTSCNSIKGTHLTYDEMKIAMKAVLAYRNKVL